MLASPLSSIPVNNFHKGQKYHSLGHLHLLHHHPGQDSYRAGILFHRTSMIWGHRHCYRHLRHRHQRSPRHSAPPTSPHRRIEQHSPCWHLRRKPATTSRRHFWPSLFREGMQKRVHAHDQADTNDKRDEFASW